MLKQNEVRKCQNSKIKVKDIFGPNPLLYERDMTRGNVSMGTQSKTHTHLSIQLAEMLTAYILTW